MMTQGITYKTGILVDHQIIEAVRQGRLTIVDPDGRPMIEKSGKMAGDAQLDTHGYILRIRRLYSWQTSGSEGRGDGWISLKGAKTYRLRPNEFVIIETYEKVSFPMDICGTIHALARLSLQGLSHISTTVHPGWGAGTPQPLRIAIKNVGNTAITLRDKDPIARLLFHQCADLARLVNPPSANDVFERLERAIKEQQKGQRNRMRFKYRLRLFILAFILTIWLLILGRDDIRTWVQIGSGVINTIIGVWVMREMEYRDREAE